MLHGLLSVASVWDAAPASRWNHFGGGVDYERYPCEGSAPTHTSSCLPLTSFCFFAEPW